MKGKTLIYWAALIAAGLAWNGLERRHRLRWSDYRFAKRHRY